MSLSCSPVCSALPWLPCAGHAHLAHPQPIRERNAARDLQATPIVRQAPITCKTSTKKRNEQIAALTQKQQNWEVKKSPNGLKVKLSIALEEKWFYRNFFLSLICAGITM